MNLAAEIAAHLPALRAQAEARMTDTVLITRAGTPTFDPETGTYPETLVIVYEGPCRIKLASTVVRDLDAQNQILAEQAPRLDLPIGESGDVKPGDMAVLTASVRDPAAIGLRMSVSGVFFQTDATARKFPVEIQS